VVVTLRFIQCNLFLIILSSFSIYATEVKKLETLFRCGKQMFSIQKECELSQDQFELNKCNETQLLIKDKKVTIKIPIVEKAKNEYFLHAVEWSCYKLNNEYYVGVFYNSGNSKLEHTELYTSNLVLINDKELLSKLVQDSKVKIGADSVKSIYPLAEKIALNYSNLFLFNSAAPKKNKCKKTEKSKLENYTKMDCEKGSFNFGGNDVIPVFECEESSNMTWRFYNSLKDCEDARATELANGN